MLLYIILKKLNIKSKKNIKYRKNYTIKKL